MWLWRQQLVWGVLELLALVVALRIWRCDRRKSGERLLLPNALLWIPGNGGSELMRDGNGCGGAVKGGGWQGSAIGAVTW